MFLTNKINDRLIVIGEEEKPDPVFSMQLVIGDKRAALIDAGLGHDRSLDAVVRKFTDLPVTLLITHGHFDHVGNAALFDDVHMSKLDDAELEKPFPHQDLTDGETFGLGGVVLEACALPGHSRGSFCFLNRRDGYVLAGDAVNQSTGLLWKTCAAPADYAETLRKFTKKLADSGISDIYHGHSMYKLPDGICGDMIAALEEIVRGDTAGDEPYHIENPGAKEPYQHRYGNAMIIYTR